MPAFYMQLIRCYFRRDKSKTSYPYSFKLDHNIGLLMYAFIQNIIAHGHLFTYEDECRKREKEKRGDFFLWKHCLSKKYYYITNTAKKSTQLSWCRVTATTIALIQ